MAKEAMRGNNFGIIWEKKKGNGLRKEMKMV